jgi:hypothetical protein
VKDILTIAEALLAFRKWLLDNRAAQGPSRATFRFSILVDDHGRRRYDMAYSGRGQGDLGELEDLPGETGQGGIGR